MGDFVFERWRQPINIISIETDFENVVDMGDGRVTLDAHIITDEEGTERLRLGHACLHCGEGQPEAFPKHCWVCGFEMRDTQAAWFNRLYTGVEDLRFKDIEAEEARMQEENERRRHNRNSRIWLPTKEI